MATSDVRTLLACALLAAAPAHADGWWYGSFFAGNTKSDHTDPLIINDEKSEGAYGIGVGVTFNDWFAAQLDWHTYGENRDYPVCCAVGSALPEHSYALRMLPRLPIGERFAIELGLGVAKWEGDFDSGGTRTDTEETDGWYSVGLAWKLGANWSITVEAQRLESDFAELEWTGASLRYRF